eukprot:m.654487 g.654487  ORF g.654487 m.654487 type:complete len:1032 (+) comp58412_c0_seq2:279-3374(+)
MATNMACLVCSHILPPLHTNYQGKRYHNECFKCKDCQRLLTPTSAVHAQTDLRFLFCLRDCPFPSRAARLTVEQHRAATGLQPTEPLAPVSRIARRESARKTIPLPDLPQPTTVGSQSASQSSIAVEPSSGRQTLEPSIQDVTTEFEHVSSLLQQLRSMKGDEAASRPVDHVTQDLAVPRQGVLAGDASPLPGSASQRKFDRRSAHNAERFRMVTSFDDVPRTHSSQSRGSPANSVGHRNSPQGPQASTSAHPGSNVSGSSPSIHGVPTIKELEGSGMRVISARTDSFSSLHSQYSGNSKLSSDSNRASPPPTPTGSTSSSLASSKLAQSNIETTSQQIDFAADEIDQMLMQPSIVDQSSQPAVAICAGYRIHNDTDPIPRDLKGSFFALREASKIYQDTMAGEDHWNYFFPTGESWAVASIRLCGGHIRDETQPTFSVILRSAARTTCHQVPVLDIPLPPNPANIINMCFSETGIQAAEVRPVPPAALMSYLQDIDHIGVPDQSKFGVVLMLPGQNSDDEFYSNVSSTEGFETFLGLLGSRVELAGFDGYAGGLDTRASRTGTHSVYSQFDGCELMFHVSTLLPFDHTEKTQPLRRKIISNDLVCIVFQDSDTPFSPIAFRSHFFHVFIVIQPQGPPESRNYRVAVLSKDEVGSFLPAVQYPSMFSHGAGFRQWLLAKLLGAETAARQTATFQRLTQRSRETMIANAVAAFQDAESSELSSATIQAIKRTKLNLVLDVDRMLDAAFVTGSNSAMTPGREPDDKVTQAAASRSADIPASKPPTHGSIHRSQSLRTSRAEPGDQASAKADSVAVPQGSSFVGQAQRTTSYSLSTMSSPAVSSRIPSRTPSMMGIVTSPSASRLSASNLALSAQQGGSSDLPSKAAQFSTELPSSQRGKGLTDSLGTSPHYSSVPALDLTVEDYPTPNKGIRFTVDLRKKIAHLPPDEQISFLLQTAQGMFEAREDELADLEAMQHERSEVLQTNLKLRRKLGTLTKDLHEVSAQLELKAAEVLRLNLLVKELQEELDAPADV